MRRDNRKLEVRKGEKAFFVFCPEQNKRISSYFSSKERAENERLMLKSR